MEILIQFHRLNKCVSLYLYACYVYDITHTNEAAVNTPSSRAQQWKLVCLCETDERRRKPEGETQLFFSITSCNIQPPGITRRDLNHRWEIQEILESALSHCTVCTRVCVLI